MCKMEREMLHMKFGLRFTVQLHGKSRRILKDWCTLDMKNHTRQTDHAYLKYKELTASMPFPSLKK